MAIPKFLVGDNTDHPESVFLIHTEFPRFVMDLDTDEIEWLDDVDGEASTFNLGARFGVGSGDIIVGASYGQLQGAGFDGATAVAVAANVTSLGIAYRHSFNETWEAFVSYDRVRTEYAAGSYDLDTGAALVGAASQSDNQFGVAVRCNVTKEIDVTVGYAWVDGDGAFSLSAGYNF